MKIYVINILDISNDIFEQLCLFITLEKKKQIDKLIYKKDKIRSLMGEIFIRIVISKKIGISNKNIKIEKNEFGKPYLKDHPGFFFNISHSGDIIICALSDNPIGVDIEEIKDVEYTDIANHFFTESEFRYIMDKDVSSRLNSFYEIWTLKESYIKCQGDGLSIPLNSFEISIDKFENVKTIIDCYNNKNLFKKLDIGSSYKAAICSRNTMISNNITIIDSKKIIETYLKL